MAGESDDGRLGGFWAPSSPEPLWLAGALLAASCGLSGPPVTPTPDRPALTEAQALEIVLARTPSTTNRQGLREYARLEYLGRGEWLVQYGSEAAWWVRE